jgi:phage-related protein
MPPPRTEKPLHWVGSSKKDLLALPAEVVDDFGYALGVVQAGATPPQAKPWKGEGPGVRTAAGDIAKIGERLKLAEQHYKELYEHQD